MWQCFYCRTPLSKEVVQKNRLCSCCGSDLHCCRNCVFFDESVSNSCKEPDSPWVQDREKFNQCPYFEFRVSQSEEKEEYLSNAAKEAKEAFRALFKNI